MTRQVRAEAVFDTSKALASMTAYNAGIQQVIGSQNQLSAAIRATQQAIGGQAGFYANAARAAAASSSVQVQSVQSVANAYNQLATQAAAAANQIRNAGNQRGPQNPGGAGGGGGGGQGGGGGGGGGQYFGLTGPQLFVGMAATGAISAAVSSAIELSDKWIDVNGRIRIATSSATEFGAVQSSLFEIAQRTRTEYGVVADQFSRLAIAGRGMGMTAEQATALVEIIADAGRAAHRSASEIQSFAVQFPQAIAKGRVAGDDFKSILGSYPQLVDIVTKNWQKTNGEIGITRGELIQLSHDQKAWADSWVNAMFRGRHELRAMAEQAPRTFEQAMVQLSNAWLKSVGEMAEKTKFTDQMTASVDKLIGVVSGDTSLSALASVLDTIAKSFANITAAIDGIISRIEWVTKNMPTLPGAAGAIQKTGLPSFGTLGQAGSYGIGGVLDMIMGMDAQDAAARRDAVERERARMSGLPQLSLYPRESFDFSTAGAAAAQKDIAPWTQSSRPEDKQLTHMRDRANETIKLLEQQIQLEEVRATGIGQSVNEAKALVEVERAITKEMREKIPLEAARIEALIKQKVAADANRETEKMRDRATETIKLLEQQVTLENAKKSGNQQQIIDAKARVETERAVTAEMAKRLPVETARIADLNKQKAAAESEKEGSTIRDRARETVRLLEQQIDLEGVRRSGNQFAITEANAQVEIERSITKEIRERAPHEAARIAALIRQKEFMEAAREAEKRDAPAREKIAQIEQETRLRQAQITGNEDLIAKEKLRLEIEKAITEELRRRNPVLAAQLETAERIKAIQEKMAQDAQKWSGLYERMGNTLVDSMMAAGREGKSFSAGLRDAGRQFADMLMRAIVFEPIIKAISTSMGAMTGAAVGGGPGSWVASLLGTAASAATGTYIGGGTSFGGWETYAMPAMAKGGVMSGGQITAFERGGVVKNPTMFQHAGGRGLMGESGDEAILPLARSPSGRLGVRAEGGGGGSPVVNNISVKVDGDMTDSTRQRLMADMERLLDQRAPGIVKDSVSAVQRKHQSNPGYLRR